MRIRCSKAFCLLTELFTSDFRACARSTRWATPCFSVQAAAAAMQHPDQPSASELSPRNELCGKLAAKCVIDFCRTDRNLLHESLACYFQSKKLKCKVVRRSLRKEKKTARPTCGGGRSRLPPSLDRRSTQPQLLQVSFQICCIWLFRSYL